MQLSLAAAALAAASPLAAQDFGTPCTVASNGLVVCASATATFMNNILTLSVDNVQGPAGDFTTNGAAHKITGVALYYAGSGMGTATLTSGPTGFTNGADDSFFGPGNGNSPGDGYSLFAAAMTQQNAGGIIGCDAAGNPTSTSTCGASPNAIFTFMLDANAQLPGTLYFAYRSQAVNDGNGDGSAKCYITNDDCAPMSSVPEPASLALVGLGLAGLGGVGLRRRSRAG